jgi:hypothetical protein
MQQVTTTTAFDSVPAAPGRYGSAENSARDIDRPCAAGFPDSKEGSMAFDRAGSSQPSLWQEVRCLWRCALGSDSE